MFGFRSKKKESREVVYRNTQESTRLPHETSKRILASHKPKRSGNVATMADGTQYVVAFRGWRRIGAKVKRARA